MTQLGERDAVDVDAHASEMFAEKPTDARADAEREPGVVREGTPPANERSREAHTGRARDRARPRGRADHAAAATPLIAIVAARTTTGTPPLAPTIPDAAAAAASKIRTSPTPPRRIRTAREDARTPRTPKYHPTQHPACEYHQRGARGDRARRSRRVEEARVVADAREPPERSPFGADE